MKLNIMVLFKVVYLLLFHIFGMLMVRGAISNTSSPSLDGTSTTRNKCSLTCTKTGILIESDSIKVCSGQTTCEWSSWRVEKYSCSEVYASRRRIHAISDTSSLTNIIDCKTTRVVNAFCNMTCDGTGSTCTDCEYCDGCQCHIYISYNSTTYASQKLEVERRRERICSQWSAWALKACMEGTFHNLHRERKCIYPSDIDLSNKLSCDWSESRYLKCNNGSIIETNRTSTECSWSPWEQCSASCGMSGQQRRTRKSQIFSFTNVSSCDPTAIKMTTDQIKYSGDSRYCTANNGSEITTKCVSSNCSNEKMTCSQTEYTQYRKCTGSKCSGDLSDNCKLVCNDGKISVQIFGGRISHVCIGNPKAPCDWEMVQSDCFKATAKRRRFLDINTSPVKCDDISKMNNSCHIKMDCGRPESKDQCDDCPDCYGTCTTEISSCNITTNTTHQLTNDIYNTVNVLQVLQKREDIRRCDREWSAWSWTQCNNKIWNQHRYRNCRYPAYVSNSCHLSESNYIHCSNEDALETPHTQIPCNWSPWESCSTSCGRGVQNRTQSVCSLSFRNLPPCDITAIKMASSCQEIDVNSSTWTSWDMGKGGNIGQRVRSGVCINQRPNCKRFIYEYIETKSCGSNLCTAESQSSKASPVIGPVIGSVVAAVAVVMVMVAVLLLVLRRQKQKKDGIAKETETNAVTNTTYNMQMESDTNTYDDLSTRKSQHVYGTLDSTNEIEGEYSFVEDSNTTKHHSDSNDNYFVLEKENASGTAEPQILDVGENYFILDKQNTMTTSVPQQMGGEDNYFVLDKEGMAEMTIPQQSHVKEDNYFVLDKEGAENPSISKEVDGEDNYFVLDKEGMADMTIPQQSHVKKDNDFVLDKEEAIKASISKEADGGENYLVLDKNVTQQSVVEEENYFVLNKMAQNNEIEGQITLS